MPFVPGEKEWVRSHYEEVPRETVDFCGDISGCVVLNLGCGEMLTDFGLLRSGVKRLVGLDIAEHGGLLEETASKLKRHGYKVPSDYKSRLSYLHYDGVRFPFPDQEFDFVFSWSAFEHITDVAAVLSEVRRVLKKNARAFVQVYPWFHCFSGSHLTDYIDEQYFQIRRPLDWVRDSLKEYAARHPEQRDFVLGHMFREYSTLNRFSADRFYRHVLEAGFRVIRARIISYDLDLSNAPEELEFSQLMVCGTKMLLTQAPPSPMRV
jgi:ubiquinone/menaquinone biosynthesis C-methylase UbiE